MKKIIALLLVCILVLSGCSVNEKTISSDISNVDENVEFLSINEPDLLQYVEDNVYVSVIDTLDCDDYFVENVEAVYVSQEYIDELTYNSKENIFFGYTLSELDEQFKGNKYVFSVDENGNTVVSEFEEYDDTYNQLLKNIAIGTGVILVCVTVSVATAGVGTGTVSLVFATAAKTGTAVALSSAGLGATASGMVEYVGTGDIEASLKAAALEGSEEFKWGAIGGVLSGGVSGAVTATKLRGATLNGLKLTEAAKIQKESKYSADTIKQIKSMEEYNVYKKAGLTEKVINGETVLTRDIDLEYVSEVTVNSEKKTVTNLERMQLGKAPVDPLTDKPYQLHHIGQKSDGTLAILTEVEHQGNSSVLNVIGKETEIDRTSFNKFRKSFWKNYAESVG